MKKIFKTIGLLALTGLVFTSCSDEDDNTGLSSIDFSPVAVQFTTSQSSYTFSEVDIDSDDPTTNTINITASIAESQPIDASFDLIVKSGNNDHDFEFSKETLVIKAGSTSATSSIILTKNGSVEGNENFIISATSNGNFTADFNLPLTINDDYINDVLDFSATWEGNFTYPINGGEVTLNFCDIDFDVALYDETATSFMGYIAATADCVEEDVLSGLPDGKYTIVIELYDNPLTVYTANADVPITMTFAQEHFIESTSFTFNGYTTDTIANTNNVVATLEVKDGYNYTVTPM